MKEVDNFKNIGAWILLVLGGYLSYRGAWDQGYTMLGGLCVFISAVLFTRAYYKI